MSLKTDLGILKFIEEPILIDHRWPWFDPFWTSRVLVKETKIGSEILGYSSVYFKDSPSSPPFLYGILIKEPILNFFYLSSVEKVGITRKATSDILRVNLVVKEKYRRVYRERIRFPSSLELGFKSSPEYWITSTKYEEELKIKPVDFYFSPFLNVEAYWAYPLKRSFLSENISSQMGHTVFSWKNYVHLNSPDLECKIFRAGQKASSFLSLNEEKLPAKRVLCIIPIPDT